MNSSFLNHQHLVNFNHNDVFSQYASLLQSINPLLLGNALGNTSNMDVFSQLTSMLMPQQSALSTTPAPLALSMPAPLKPQPSQDVTSSSSPNKLQHHAHSKSIKKEHHHHHQSSNSHPNQSEKVAFSTSHLTTNGISKSNTFDANFQKDNSINSSRIKVENNGNNSNSNLVEIVEAKIKLPLKYGYILANLSYQKHFFVFK